MAEYKPFAPQKLQLALIVLAMCAALSSFNSKSMGTAGQSHKRNLSG